MERVSEWACVPGLTLLTEEAAQNREKGIA